MLEERRRNYVSRSVLGRSETRRWSCVCTLLGFFCVWMACLACFSRLTSKDTQLPSRTSAQNSLTRQLKQPKHLQLRIWEPVLEQTKAVSLRCPNFLFYSVLVLSSVNEEHHQLTYRPNVTESSCAVLLLLYTERNEKHTKYSKLGWNVISLHAKLSPSLSRRVSRVPKLMPTPFFPSTKVVLYSDTKYVGEISHLRADKLACFLLQGTQFGVIQHPRTASLYEEKDAIVSSARGKRIVDSYEALNLQILRLDTVLTYEETHWYGIEGRLHAHRLKGARGTSQLFDQIWFDELNAGCDRDQIAFYAAAARMQLKLAKEVSCGRLIHLKHKKVRRCGMYVSEFDKRFSMFLHSEIPSHVE